MTDTADLISELETELNISAVDAHRAAFTALAFSCGWSKAKIGRYLGITRQRVTQKIERLEIYTKEEPRRFRQLTAVFKRAREEAAENAASVQFHVSDWDDIYWARQVIEKLV